MLRLEGRKAREAWVMEGSVNIEHQSQAAVTAVLLIA